MNVLVFHASAEMAPALPSDSTTVGFSLSPRSSPIGFPVHLKNFCVYLPSVASGEFVSASIRFIL